MGQTLLSGVYHILLYTFTKAKRGENGVQSEWVIVHGHFAACYTLNSNLPGGTNVTIECLHRTFLKLRAQGKRFPPNLYLQLDNTSKDNKSRFVVAYLYMLVCCGCFDEIDVFFFEVGHTHCDADQLFSRSSIYLRDKDIWNFDLLCHHLMNSCAMIEFVEVNGSWTDYKSRADYCQEITNDNIQLNSDIFEHFNKP